MSLSIVDLPFIDKECVSPYLPYLGTCSGDAGTRPRSVARGVHVSEKYVSPFLDDRLNSPAPRFFHFSFRFVDDHFLKMRSKSLKPREITTAAIAIIPNNFRFVRNS